jgi:Fur family ferric uptake transcriptional regulator
MVQLMNDLEAKCVAAGLKMTGQRRVIIQVLSSGNHQSVETVCRRAKEIDNTISMATVYRTLNLLDELSLIQKLDLKDNFARFDVNQEHHHHMVDLETGEVIEFMDEELEKLKHAIASRMGYDLVDHTLELYGRKKRISQATDEINPRIEI